MGERAKRNAQAVINHATEVYPIREAEQQGIVCAVTRAVGTGQVTPKRSEIAKVIDAYVKAYQTAELDKRVAQLSHAEPMKIIAMAGHGETVSPVGGVLMLQSLIAKCRRCQKIKPTLNVCLDYASVGDVRGAVSALSCALSPHRAHQFCH